MPINSLYNPFFKEQELDAFPERGLHVMLSRKTPEMMAVEGLQIR